MKKLLRRPMTNAVCIGLFSLFYTILFFFMPFRIDLENVMHAGLFWNAWSAFLSAGYQKYIATVLMILTILLIAGLVSRRELYDEYHISNLTGCLVVSLILTFIAIALLFYSVLWDPSRIIEKFTLFIVIHWVTVLLSDLVFIFIYRRR